MSSVHWCFPPPQKFARRVCVNVDEPQAKKTNWLLWIGLIGVVLVGLPIACCGSVIFWGVNIATAPLDAAGEALSTEASVAEKLGTPVSYENIGISNFTNENGNGSATIDSNFSGPNGSAHVTGTMQLNAGTWSVDHLIVTFEDGSEVELQ